MIVYDFEVFMFDWLVVFKNITTSERTIIINNSDEFKEFYNTNKNSIFVGYNNKAFDDILYRGILSDVDPYTTSTLLMNTENKYSAYKLLGIKQFPLYSMDLMQDVLGMSLKQAEGYMGLSVEECSIPFTLDRKLTEQEIQEVVKYCIHDVDATCSLLDLRKNYVQAKLELVRLYNMSLNDLSLTNAGLCARVLNAKRKTRDDELVYDIIPEIQIKHPIYRQVFSLYDTDKLDYSKTLKMDICGVEHTLAYGGLHAARNNFVYKGEMWNIDINSFYPSMMIEYEFLSRNCTSLPLYAQIYTDRISAKKAGDKRKADAYKLVLNTTYGAMKSEFNPLYDPKMANQVCITGQLLFVDLLEKLEPYCVLVQTNTDGILIIPKNKEKIQEVVHEWTKRTRMTVKIDKCTKIWQKDVNNYIMVEENDGKIEIKTKGSYVSQYEQNIRNTTRILDIAVVNYFVNDTPVEETINNCNDIFMFQYITKTGGSYNETRWITNSNIKTDVVDSYFCGYNTPVEHKSDVGNYIVVNNVNRVYASKNTNYGTLIKVKNNRDIHREDSIASLPTHCVVDNDNNLDISQIDKQWYIDAAHDRIHGFMGK